MKTDAVVRMPEKLRNVIRMVATDNGMTMGEYIAMLVSGDSVQSMYEDSLSGDERTAIIEARKDTIQTTISVKKQTSNMLGQLAEDKMVWKKSTVLEDIMLDVTNRLIARDKTR